MTLRNRATPAAMLILLLSAAQGTAAPPTMTLDLATVSTNDGIARWVYGATGEGVQGVPVTGGPDCDGDGLRDYAVAYFKADPLDRLDAGEIDLVFGSGTISGFVDTSFSDPDILRIAGAGVQEAAGNTILMDDVTGDGLGDLLISRQNFTPEGSRIGSGALTILAGGPALRSHAASLEFVDLAAPPGTLTLLTLVGAGGLDRLGIWVRTGDVTGDGIADVVVGADQEDAGGEANSGAVYVIRGGSHLAQDAEIDLQSFGSTPLAGHIARITPPSGAAGYHLGGTCQIADLDGNGRGEVLAAATLFRGGAAIPAANAPPGSAESSGGAPRGTLYIVWDDDFPDRLWPAGYTLELPRPSGTVIRGAAADLHFGEEILGGRDYDHDGRADLFVGDLAGDGSAAGDRAFSGIGYVFYGAADLKGSTVDLASPPPGLALTTLLGPQTGALGADTAAHGDFDGDGIDDLAVTAPHASPNGRESAGVVHVLFGRTGRWPPLIDTSPGNLPPSGALRSTEIQGAAGTSGTDLGDTIGYSAAAAEIDDDPLTDLIINEMLGNGVTPGTIDVGNLVIVSGAALFTEEEEEGCRSGPTVLCLDDGRFEVEVDWRDFQGKTGSGRVVIGARDSGLFWFFSPSNWELLVKVLDGCGVNGHFWVFSAATTTVEYTLRVTDLRSGSVKEYVNPLGVSAAAVTDTGAFATCP